MQDSRLKYDKYLRTEHSLIVFPFIFILLVLLYSPEKYLDVFVAGSYVRASLPVTGIFWIAFSLIPYFFHVLLRDLGLRNKAFCRFHVFATILLMLSLFIIYKQTPPWDNSWNTSIIPIPTFDYLEKISRIVTINWALLLLVQTAFMFFSFAKLLIPEKLQQPTA